MVLTKARDRADDLAQATCERALLNADKFDDGTQLDIAKPQICLMSRLAQS